MSSRRQFFRDYDDSPQRTQVRSNLQEQQQQQQQSSSLPASESGSEGARETDPVLNGQMTLFRAAPRNPYETFMQPEPIYAYGRMPSRPPFMAPHPPPPPPMVSFNGPRMVPPPPPPHPSMLLTDECMPPPPPEAFMHPMAFGPPMMPMPMDFELFTFDEQKRKKRKHKLKKYHSMECVSFPPPMPPPMFFPPPMGMMPPAPPPPAFVMHPPPPPPDVLMPPMLMNPDAFGMNPDGFNMQHMIHPHQLALPAPPTSNGPPPMPYHQMTLNRQSTLNGFNQKTLMNDGTLKSCKSLATKNGMKNKSEKPKPKSSCHRICCQGFSQIIWIIVGIILLGLVSGLVLGLTL